MLKSNTQRVRSVAGGQRRTGLGSSSGFTLVEGLVAIAIIATVGMLLTTSFSFSLASQDEARLELEATRAGGQIIEILRATSFDALNLVQDGNLDMDPLGKFQQLVLADIEERLQRHGLNIFLTIQPYMGRDEMKELHLVIASQGVSPRDDPEDVPGGKVLIRQSTFVTRKGINP